MSGPAIRARGLTRRFGDFLAVSSLDLEVDSGTIFAFLGGNGSGKSTTIRMLIGLLTPTEGEIEVDGVDVRRHPRRVRDRVGYMGQRVSLYQGLSLRENVEFYAGLYGLGGERLDRRWRGLFERFDLSAAAEERPENLPAGLRQRAGLALSILHEPRLVFLDEPTAGVDVHSRSVFWDLIREQKAQGVTVFVTTHFLEEVDDCDRVCFIDAGRLIADETPEGLRARWSDGTKVTVGVSGAAATAARERLRAAGFEAELVDGALALRLARFDPEAQARLVASLGPEAASALRVAPAPMNEVFRRLILAARGAPPP